MKPSSKGSNSGQKSCGSTIEDDFLSGHIIEDESCDCALRWYWLTKFIIHVYIDSLFNRNTTQIARLRRTPSTLGQAVTICSISAAQKIQKLSEICP